MLQFLRVTKAAILRRPKTYFLRPDVALPLGFALVREIFNQKIMGRPSQYVSKNSAAVTK